MTDIYILVIVLGVLFVLGVLAYNWWQEKKLHTRISSEFKSPKRDVLTDDFEINTNVFDVKRHAEPTQNIFSNEKPRQDSAHISGIKQGVDAQLEDSQQVLDEAFADNKFAFEATQPELEKTSNFTLPTDIGDADSIQSTIFETSENTEEVFSNTEPFHLPNAPMQTQPNKTISTITDSVWLPDSFHPQIDLIGLLFASKPLSASQVIGVTGQFSGIDRTVLMFGLSTRNEWLSIHALNPDETFSQIAYALQLADRGGAVSRETLNRFQHLVETIGLDLNAHVEWQGNGNPLNNAMLLDQFSIDVDKVINVHLIANQQAFHATKFKGIAEAHGLVLADGKYKQLSAQSSIPDFMVVHPEGLAFSADMLKNTVLNGLTFQLEIPNVSNSEQTFNRMVALALDMGKSLDVTLVDDHKKPLGDIQLEKIRQQLKVIHATMVAKGVIPGSEHALRLFS